MSRDNKLLFIENNQYRNVNGVFVQRGGNFHLGIRVPSDVEITADDIRQVKRDAQDSSDLERILQNEFDKDIHKCGGIILPRDMSLSKDNVSFFSEGDTATSSEELKDLVNLLESVDQKIEDLVNTREKINGKVRSLTRKSKKNGR